MGAAALGRGIAAGEIDPVELTQGFLDTINAHPLKDRIYARLTPERALSEAKAAAARAKAGQRLSPLDGVPASWKDLFDTAGTATEAGSALLKGRIPDDDAQVLKNATAMGLICLGKTHLSELAFSGLGYNPVTATPPCVNDDQAVSGGSSSGAAASVAFHLAPLAIGSDTGGSVRLPAAWNDLVGLKTTSGRVSLQGVVPLCPKFDTVGPLCHSVEDAALALAVLEGNTPIDLNGAGLSGRRMMVLKTVAHDDLAEPIAAEFAASLDRLARAGVILVEVDAPEVAEAIAIAGPLFTAEAYGTWGTMIEANPDMMFDQVRERFRAGAQVKAPDYVAAWQKLDQLRTTFLARLSGFDAAIVPSAPNMPPKLDRLIADSDYFVTQNLLALRNTRIGNLMGLCGLTLPTHTPSVGVTLLGMPFAEERLLRLGHASEELFHH